MNRMKTGKTVGDDMPVEAWKCLGELAVDFLTRKVKNRWRGA